MHLSFNSFRFWHQILKEWAFSLNRDDHKTGWRAILAFFRACGRQLGKTKNDFAVNYLLRQIGDVLADPKSPTKQTSLAIQVQQMLLRNNG